MKECRDVEVQLHPFLNSALDGGVCVCGQLHTLATLHPIKNPHTHYIGRWVGPRANLDLFGEENMYCSFWDLNPGPPSHWQAAVPSTVSQLLVE